MRRRLALAVLAGILIAACSKTYAPPPLPRTPAGLAEASSVLREVAERRRDVHLTEGGLVLDAWTYEWKKSDMDAEFDRQSQVLNDPHGLDDSRSGAISERKRTGPVPVRVTPENLRAVRVRTYLLGTTLEFDLEDHPEPVFLDVKDRAEGERLGAAIDLMRQAAAARRPASTRP